MPSSGFDLGVWAATFVVDLLLLAVLWARRRGRSFPVFTTLIAFYVMRAVVFYSVLRFIHTHVQRDYYYMYWSFAAVDELLQAGVFYELTRKIFCPTGTWARDVRSAFVGLILACSVVALLLTWLASPSARVPIQSYVLRGNFFDSMLMSELFAGILILSARAGLPWKTHTAKVAQGLGVYSALCVMTRTAENYFGLAQGSGAYDVISRLRILIYLACAGYWIVTLWQAAPEPRELPEGMRQQIYTLQRRVQFDLVRIRSWRRY